MSVSCANTSIMSFANRLESIHTAGRAAILDCGDGITVLTFDAEPGPKRHLEINGKDYTWCTRLPSAGDDSQTGNQSRFTANMTDHDGNITRKEAVFGNGTLPPITTLVSQAPPGYEVEGAFPPTNQFTNTQQPTTEHSQPAFQVGCLYNAQAS